MLSGCSPAELLHIHHCTVIILKKIFASDQIIRGSRIKYKTVRKKRFYSYIFNVRRAARTEVTPTGIKPTSSSLPQTGSVVYASSAFLARPCPDTHLD